MNILYVGDVMGEAGIRTVTELLPTLRQEEHIDVVIAQAENATGGKGTSPEDFRRLLACGVDFCSGGNWSLKQPAIIPLMDDPKQPIIRPANYPDGTPGLGYKYVETSAGPVLVISLVGHVVGREADRAIDNPLKKVDSILASQVDTPRAACIVNFHGDYSSEKVVIGHYLDGRVTAVIGDHWHVPTADARILPHGTAHITDVGMCGTLESSLGITLDSIIPRWRDGVQTRNEQESKGPRQFNALRITTDDEGLASEAEFISRIIQ